MPRNRSSQRQLPPGIAAPRLLSSNRRAQHPVMVTETDETKRMKRYLIICVIGCVQIVLVALAWNGVSRVSASLLNTEIVLEAGAASFPKHQKKTEPVNPPFSNNGPRLRQPDAVAVGEEKRNQQPTMAEKPRDSSSWKNSALVKNSSPSPTARYVNQVFQQQGVLLRVPDDGAQFTPDITPGVDFLPASYAHASMRAPNLLYREISHRKRGYPNVGLVLASRYFNHYGSKKGKQPDKSNQNMVHCRAYYPSDAWSVNRTTNLVQDPRGTSCTQEQVQYASTTFCGQDCYYNVTNACQCTIPGKDILTWLDQKQQQATSESETPPSLTKYGWGTPTMMGCWYSDDDDDNNNNHQGLQQVIDASNAFWLAQTAVVIEPPVKLQKKMTKFAWHPHNINQYKGWTECSAVLLRVNKDGATGVTSQWTSDPNHIQKLADAIVVDLPMRYERLNGTGPALFDIQPSSFSSPEYDSKLFPILSQQFQELAQKKLHHLPILIFQQSVGLDPDQCQLLWQGHDCGNGLHKEFLSPTVFAGDHDETKGEPWFLRLLEGACLAQSTGDDEVRYYLANSTICTSLANTKS